MKTKELLTLIFRLTVSLEIYQRRLSKLPEQLISPTDQAFIQRSLDIANKILDPR
jgi:hypothetical protein